MKKLLFLSVLIIHSSLLLFNTASAQAPSGFTYQSVLRDANNDLIINTTVGTQISILQTTAGGTAVYVETHTASTNANGLLTLQVGAGSAQSGTFASIDWSAGPYFVKTETDPAGGATYTITGTQQMMSVPYALYAETSGTGGAAGATGAVGATGDTGATGPTGADGADGATGPQGAVGATGADGQGGVTQPGTNVTITGAGTGSDPYVVNATDNVDDLDNDPTNEIELPSGGQEGQILTIIGGVPTWVNSPCIVKVGDTYAGGVVFYVDASGCHGLVAAPSDQSSSAGWGCYGALVGANGIAIGTGNQNTINIEAGCSDPGTAAHICANLSLAGYTDWFLPSRGELNKMYQNIGQGNALGLGNVGGFAPNYYWSSTEATDGSAWAQIFNGGGQTYGGKTSALYVRAVRAF
jgi:hypothetical protein